MNMLRMFGTVVVACVLLAGCSDAGGLIIVEYEDADPDAGIECDANTPVVDAAQACAEKGGVCP